MLDVSGIIDEVPLVLIFNVIRGTRDDYVEIMPYLDRFIILENFMSNFKTHFLEILMK